MMAIELIVLSVLSYISKAIIHPMKIENNSPYWKLAEYRITLS